MTALYRNDASEVVSSGVLPELLWLNPGGRIQGMHCLKKGISWLFLLCFAAVAGSCGPTGIEKAEAIVEAESAALDSVYALLPESSARWMNVSRGEVRVLDSAGQPVDLSRDRIASGVETLQRIRRAYGIKLVVVINTQNERRIRMVLDGVGSYLIYTRDESDIDHYRHRVQFKRLSDQALFFRDV